MLRMSQRIRCLKYDNGAVIPDLDRDQNGAVTVAGPGGDYDPRRCAAAGVRRASGGR
jgi:hypothetical protein